MRDAARSGLECRSVSAANQLDLAAALRLAARLARFRPDIVHAHTPRDFLAGFLASRMLGGARFVLTRHMMLPLKPIMRWVYSKSTAVICLSSSVRTHLVAEGIPPVLLRRVRSGIDTTQFGCAGAISQRPRLRREWGLDDTNVALGVVGRIVTGKGHDNVLDAAATLVRRESSDGPASRLRILIIGEGPERGRLAARTRDAGLEGVVQFTGPREDMPAALAALDGLVLASQSELLPLAVMEAMATGLPVIATEVGGLAEAIEPDCCGMLVPPGDSAALATAICRIVGDPRLRMRLGAAAAVRARREYTLAAMATDTASVYRDILAG